MIVEELIAHQDDPGTAIGHLTAVEPADPTLDAGVERIVAAVSHQVGHLPVAGLGIGVTPGVGEVDGGNPVQVGVVDAVPPVVFVGDLGEHRRPEEFGVSALMSGPGRGAQVLGAGFPGHRLFQFEPQHQSGPVVAGP